MRWSTASLPSSPAAANVTFGRDGKPPTLVAKAVDIGFSTRQFSDPLHADEIVLSDGTLNLSPSSASLPFAADRLQLRNMAFNSPETGWALSAQRVDGGVSPGRRKRAMCWVKGTDSDERRLADPQRRGCQ